MANVTVTLKHLKKSVALLKKSRQARSEKCPLAIAIKEDLGLTRGVGAASVSICIDSVIYNTPRVAARFVRAFDRAFWGDTWRSRADKEAVVAMLPFTFRLIRFKRK